MDILSQALSQGIAPAIVVVIYLIIVKVLDNRKEKTQSKLNAELAKSINTISSFLENITKDIVDKDKEKCKIAINDAFNSSAMALIHFASTTIVNNHIDTNKDSIVGNIHNMVNGEYYSIYSTLSLYTYNGKKVSEYMDKNWILEIEQDINSSIFNTCITKEERILSVSNKIMIRFQSYITKLINNAS